MSSTDYWKMTPSEIGAVIEHKRPKTVGNLQEADYDRLMERREQMEAEGLKVM